MREFNIEARPWQPQDLIDDLQMMIDEEPDSITNGKRVTLCTARDYLKGFFANVTDTNVGSKWIPVTERLPENDTTVLVYRPKMAQKVMTSYYFGRWTDGATDIHGNEVITHWMPLPQLPEDGGADHEN